MRDGKRRSAETEVEVEVSMTPMIDVTFQLLVFFLVTLQFRKLERVLDSFLPTDRGPHAPDSIVDESTIEIGLRMHHGAPRMYYARQLVDAPLAEACAVVERRLIAFEEEFPAASVRLDVGRGVTHADAVRALDMVHRAKMKTIQLAGIGAMTPAELERWVDEGR